MIFQKIKIGYLIRYIVYDLVITNEDNIKQNKLVFIFYSPDGSSIFVKTKYASGK